MAVLIALGFLVFSVPLITGALGLAQAVNIDARVKSDLLDRDYCGLAVSEYIGYLSKDTERWDDRLAGNEEPGTPGVYEVVADLCGETINIGLTQLADLPPETYTGPPLGDPLLIIPSPDDPDIDDYDGRELQTLKTVSNSNPTGGDSVAYTITLINRGTTSSELVSIRENLPSEFTYDCDALPDLVSLPGEDLIAISIEGDCPPGENIEWLLPPVAPDTSIDPGEEVILTFTAVTCRVYH